MNWKAIGIDTGTIYATGTHADCSRAVNETKRGELVKIMRADQAFEPMDDNAEIDRLAKEWQLMELQDTQANREKYARKHQPREWTAEEMDWLAKNIDETAKWLINGMRVTFGREITSSMVNNRKHKLRVQLGLVGKQANIQWMEEEDAYLIAHYHEFTAADISRDVGRTRKAVETRAGILKKAGKLAFKNKERGQKNEL